MNLIAVYQSRNEGKKRWEVVDSQNQREVCYAYIEDNKIIFNDKDMEEKNPSMAEECRKLLEEKIK
jgi:hypothetical protein